jgi:hypothetical protein
MAACLSKQARCRSISSACPVYLLLNFVVMNSMDGGAIQSISARLHGNFVHHVARHDFEHAGIEFPGMLPLLD